MPIPILKMKGLRRTAGVGIQGDVTRIAQPDQNTCFKTPSGPRSFSRTATATPGGNLGTPNPAAASHIPSFKGKEMRLAQPSQSGRSQNHLPGPAHVIPAASLAGRQTRSTAYGTPKTPSHSRQLQRSQVANSNLTASSTSKASSGAAITQRVSNANERIKKYGLSKPSTTDKSQELSNSHHVNSNHISNLASYCGDSNSNRSSIISNCSSIPAPSSSSSNRNSSSSISSNFSVGSLSSNCGGISESREPRSYPGASGGSDTFPRTNSIKRSKHTEQLMAKSMDGVDQRSIGSSNNSLQRPTNRPRLREPQKISRPSNSQISSSESAISGKSNTRTPSSSASYNTSESNLSKLRFDRQQEGRQSARGIPKPTATVRGKGKPSSIASSDLRTSNHRGTDQRQPQGEKRLRSIPQTQTKRHELKGCKENVALVTPFAANGNKAKAEPVVAPHTPQPALQQPPPVITPPPVSSEQENAVQGKKISEIDALEEDDGYSSVVNTDQHEDEDASCSSCATSRAESDELLQIEPMKPLEGMSSYSYLQSFREYKARRSYPHCSNTADENQRNSVPIDLQTSKWQFEQQECSKFSPTTNLKSHNSPQPPTETHQPHAEPSKIPYSHLTSKVKEVTSFTNQAAQNPTSFVDHSANTGKLRDAPPSPSSEASSAVPTVGFAQGKSSKSGLNPSYPSDSDGSAPSYLKPDPESTFPASENARPSSFDEASYLGTCKSYPNSLKKEISSQAPNYNWMVRNTIAGVPVIPPNRKYTMVGDSMVGQSPSSTRPSPSLPALTNAYPHRPSEQRPISLDSSKLSYTPRYSSSSCPSPLLYRAGSLRSPARLLAHTPPPPPEDDSSLPISSTATPFASSFQSFVRGSPKYSTVIPCTPSSEDDAYLKDPKPDLSVPFGGVASPASPYAASETLAKLSEDELRLQLLASREKIFSLTEQLSSSNKLVTAYEHSLTNMTHRLHQLTLLAEKKEAEVSELRKLLERSCFDSAVHNQDARNAKLRGRLNRGASVESLSSLASNISISSEVSSTSFVSSNSFSSCESEAKEKASKKRNWFRSSFSKAFKRREKRKRGSVFSPEMSHGKVGSEKGGEDALFLASLNEQNRGYCSLPSSPLPLRLRNRLSDVMNVEGDQHESIETSSLVQEIARLKKLLIEKDSSLTESRLESLSSAHQIEALKESVHKLSAEVKRFKHSSSEFNSLEDTLTAETQDGLHQEETQQPPEHLSFELNCHPTVGSPVSSRSSAGSLNDALANICPGSPGKEGRRIRIYVERSSDWHAKHGHPHKKIFIKTILVASKTSWAELDSLVCHSFLDDLKHLDADLKLSLNADAILHYQVGEVTRTLSFESPELLPFGYLVGDVDNIKLILKNPSFNSVDSLTFETLIPKPHLQRYITLLKDHRRVILEGPEGVGKSYLAQKMAEFVVQRLGIEPSSGNIAKFQVNGDTQQELSAYLTHLSDLCESKSSDLPLVIILESLEKVEKLQEALSCSLRVQHDQCPFIIGTCRHSRNRKSDLIQLNNNFRWISLNPNFEPIRELLTRICRRHSGSMNRHSSRRYRLEPLLEWLPRCLDKVNAVLSSSSSVGPIGPGILLPFPEDLGKAEVWFYDVWKRRLLPYLQKAAEDASFIPNDLRSWQDLDTCLREELPWSFSDDKMEVSMPQMPKVELG